jgi:hypothetical protein
MFSHNLNSRDLAFEYEDNDFMAHYKNNTRNENDYREKYSPREVDANADDWNPKINDHSLKSHASLFPKIFNFMITKQEKSDHYTFK